MAESFTDHFAESAARTNAIRRSLRVVEATRERESSRARDERLPTAPERLRHATLDAYRRVGLGGPDVTHEDEMNARLASELDQLEAYKARRDLAGATSARDASPIVRDAIDDALAAEAYCANLFSVYNPPASTLEDMGETPRAGDTPDGFARGALFSVASRPSLVRMPEDSGDGDGDRDGDGDGDGQTRATRRR